MLSRGALYMVASALGFSTMSALVKLAGTQYSTGQIVFARAVVTLAISYLMIRRAEIPPLGNRRSKLIVRGLLGFAGLTGFYISIARLPLADAQTLQQTTPVFTAVAAWWILNEPIGWRTGLAIACGLGGVMLVVHPGSGSADVLGVVIALIAAVLSAAAYITVRQLSRTEHPLVIVMYFSLVTMPLALPWAATTWVHPNATDWLLLLAIGAATQIGQVFLTKALAIERAGRVAAMGYLQIGFAVVWQLVLFAVWPTFGTIAGAALIIAGTLMVSAAKSLGSSERRHSPRQIGTSRVIEGDSGHGWYRR